MLSQLLFLRSSSTRKCAQYSEAIAAAVSSLFFNLLMCTTFWSYRSRCLVNLLQLANMNYILMLSQLLFLHSSSICKCAQHSEAIAAAVSSLFFKLLMCTTFWSYRSRCLFALLQLANVHYILRLSQPLSLHSPSTCYYELCSYAIAAAVSSLFFNLLLCTTFWSCHSRCLFALLQLANVHYILKLSQPLSLRSSSTC
jgi:hypothetical protein